MAQEATMSMGFDPGPDGHEHLYGWYDYEYSGPGMDSGDSQYDKEAWITKKIGKPEDDFTPEEATMQYVKLDLGGRAYTYAWPFEDVAPLLVGDVVWIPGNSVNPEKAQAKVVRLLDGPDYDGPITEILELV